MPGCCRGTPEAETSRNIDKQLELESRGKQLSVRMLLLGPGDSGKSTIAKQMKIIHLNGFTERERAEWKPIVYRNAVFGMRIIVRKAQEFGYQLQAHNTQNSELLLQKDEAGGLFGGADIRVDENNKNVLLSLWSDPAVRATYARAAEYQVNDSAAYFFENLDRLGSPDYLPTQRDVLMSKIKTTGIHEISFTLDRVLFTLIDVGGQRSERRKWIHCFEGATCLLYCAAISSYDQRLFEDPTVNRMHEALQLFTDIVQGPWFKTTDIILYLNKKDIFELKLPHSPLTNCFPDYNGNNSYDDAVDFITQQFLRRKARQNVFVHVTCATNTDNMLIVWNHVSAIVVRDTLAAASVPF